MRFMIPRRECRFSRQKRWHDWFAWYPVRLASGELVWLEYLVRRKEYNMHYGGLDEYWVYMEDQNGWDEPDAADTA